jgi:hypothetical protein
MAYELWDIRSGNLIAALVTEDEALGLVRDALRENGEDYVLNLALTREDPEGNTTAVADAQRLIDLSRTPA